MDNQLIELEALKIEAQAELKTFEGTSDDWRDIERVMSRIRALKTEPQDNENAPLEKEFTETDMHIVAEMSYGQEDLNKMRKNVDDFITKLREEKRGKA